MCGGCGGGSDGREESEGEREGKRGKERERGEQQRRQASDCVWRLPFSPLTPLDALFYFPVINMLCERAQNKK